ncbi:MAG: uracil-DNA glycosylase family protein, partial [Hyphomicrobium sp.]
MPQALDRLLAEIRACQVCRTQPRGAPLAHEPRPVVRASETARILIVGQAPGTKVHASGKPFDDRSGDRLRAWMNVPPEVFYDETSIAIAPMGFCFPGQDAKGGDLPPRKECAPLWRPRLMQELAAVDLVLLVGTYA